MPASLPEAPRCRSPVVRPVLPCARPRPIAGKRLLTSRAPIRGAPHCSDSLYVETFQACEGVPALRVIQDRVGWPAWLL
jgi:hypothetical protein